MRLRWSVMQQGSTPSAIPSVPSTAYALFTTPSELFDFVIARMFAATVSYQRHLQVS